MGLNAIIDANRLDWDRHDPWGSGMTLLGAVCDFYTLAEFDLAGHQPIPAALGYRPAMGLSLTSRLTDNGPDADPEDRYEWDSEMWDVAYACGFSLIHNGESDEPDLTASPEDWHRAPALLLQTMVILHRYLDLVEAAGKSY